MDSFRNLRASALVLTFAMILSLVSLADVPCPDRMFIDSTLDCSTEPIANCNTSKGSYDKDRNLGTCEPAFAVKTIHKGPFKCTPLDVGPPTNTKCVNHYTSSPENPAPVPVVQPFYDFRKCIASPDPGNILIINIICTDSNLLETRNLICKVLVECPPVGGDSPDGPPAPNPVPDPVED